MIDHLGILVSDMVRSRAFYVKALAPIRYEVLLEYPASVTGTTDVVGFGERPNPDFWLSVGKQMAVHVAFRVQSRKLVDEFYKAAIAAGGKDNGGPGLRPHYHKDYYGAFVLDPDGHNIEAVCHLPEG